MNSVGIVYGWAEGPRLSKSLRRELRKAGFAIARNLDQADIIIAHSGGCYMLPSQVKANIILLVGLPYWPGKYPVHGLKQKVQSEVKNLMWFKKTALNSYYLVTRPRQWLKMWRAWQKATLPTSNGSSSIIAIRNEHDPFMHPTETDVLAKKYGWQTKLLSGHHDDLWLNPEPYVDILKAAFED